MSERKPLKDRESYPGRQAITQHLWRHHEQAKAPGTVEERLQSHDDLHWAARTARKDLGHTHGGYQDGETINDIARRMLAEGSSEE